MGINESDFFREAALRLCGNLDIQKALWDCSKYLKEIVPLTRMYVLLFDPDMHVTQIISSISWTDVRGVTSIHIPERYRREWIHKWDGCLIMNDHNSEHWFWDHLHSIGWSDDISVLILRLKVGEAFCMFGLIENGQGVYTEEHAHLISLLKEPLTIAIANALQHREMLRFRDLQADEHRRLLETLRGISDDIVGKQIGLKEAMRRCNQIAPLDSPVLLLGETGVGKDLFATTIHNYSSRSQGPFVSINCGAITETLLDSELFGHEKGAFTGAVSQKMGRFERADKGTIYLDEIGELSPQGQVRLLRVIQYKEIERVGGTRPVRVDARIIAATNRNLEEMVKSGQFRQDLWYRLNVFPITIPPLRERKQDIADLTVYFVNKKRKELKLDITPRFPPNTIELLMEYDWPGNVRELQNVIERALITNRDGFLPFDELITISSEGSDTKKHHVPIPQIDLNAASEMETLDQHTFAYIQLAMTRSEGKINGPGGTAELLGIHPNTLRKKMDKLGIPYKKKT